MRFLLLIFKNLRRNPFRTALSALGTMVLVLVVSLVWSILSFLDSATSEKNTNFKIIITERWSIPSRLPFSYVTSSPSLAEGAYAGKPGDIRPDDYMTWQFFGGTLEKSKRTRENSLFGIGVEPEKIMSMMDELDSLPPDQAAEFAQVIDKLKANRQGMILGRERLAAIQKRVGDRIKLYTINYQGLEMEFDIVGEFPPGRYDNSMVYRGDYLLSSLDAFKVQNKGVPHKQADRTLNLVWLRVPHREAMERISAQIDREYGNASPAVKCESQSAGIAAFLEAYRDLLWGMRYLLSPAVLVTLSLVIANAISISVRERRLELAVLKVLGFRPGNILAIVLGEAVLIGVLAGLASAGLTYGLVNHVLGGIPFPIAFFPKFFIPANVFWWGLAVGGGTALVGSLIPAWSAMSVKVADVFAKVA